MLMQSLVRALCFPVTIIFITRILGPSAWFQRLHPTLKVMTGMLIGLAVATTIILTPADANVSLPIWARITFGVLLPAWIGYWAIKNDHFRFSHIFTKNN